MSKPGVDKKLYKKGPRKWRWVGGGAIFNHYGQTKWGIDQSSFRQIVTTNPKRITWQKNLQ